MEKTGVELLTLSNALENKRAKEQTGFLTMKNIVISFRWKRGYNAPPFLTPIVGSAEYHV